MVWNVELESWKKVMVSHQQFMEQFVCTGPRTTHPNGLAYGMSPSLVGFATFLNGKVPWGPTSSNPNGLAMFQSGVVPYGAGGRVPWGPTSSNPNGFAMFQSGMVPYGVHSVVHGRSDPLSSWTTSRINHTRDISLYRSTETHVAGVVTDFVHFGVANDVLFFGFSLFFFSTPFWNNTKLDLTHWLYSTTSQEPILGY
jgi:hypothetical protein